MTSSVETYLNEFSVRKVGTISSFQNFSHVAVSMATPFSLNLRGSYIALNQIRP